MVVNFPRKIKVAALNRPFFFEFPVNDSTKPGGIDGALLHLLSQIFKFEYQINSPQDREYGTLAANGNWTGVIGMVSRSEADLGMSLLAITQSRLPVVDFSVPHIFSDITFATKYPGTLPTAYTYVHAFDIYTWMCLAALFFLMPVVFRLMVKNCSYIDTQMAVFGHLLKTPIPMKVLDGKPLTVFWCLCAYVLSVSYAASISSLLFNPPQGLPIETVEELSEAVTRGNFKVKMLKGASHIQASLVLSPSEHIKSLGKSIVRNDWYFRPNFNPYEELSQKDVAIVSSRLILNLFFGFPPFASKFISDDSFSTVRIGMAMRKTFCCKEQLNSALSRLVEAGIINKFIRDEVHRSTHDNLRNHLDGLVSHVNRPLSLKDLSGAFIIFLFGLVSSLIVLVSEMFYHKFCCWRSK